MKLGLSSLLFVCSSIEKAIRMSAELGAECFEIIHDVPHFMPNHEPALDTIRELLGTYGLEVFVHASFWDLDAASTYRELFDLTLKRVRRGIEMCDELGGEIVTLHPGRYPVAEVEWLMRDTKNRYFKFLRECTKLAGELGIRLALENVSASNCFYPTPEDLEKFVGDFEGICATLDVGHAYCTEKKAGVRNPEEKIAGVIERLGEHLGHVHLHDNHGKEDEHLPPGEGEIDFEPIFDALLKVNYGGHLIAELWNPKNPLETGRKGLNDFKVLLDQVIRAKR